jgi:hypothetical protein
MGARFARLRLAEGGESLEGPGIIKGDVEIEVEAMTARGEPAGLSVLTTPTVTCHGLLRDMSRPAA